MNKKLMRKYARLAVVSGAAVKKGQGCIISADVHQRKFVELITEEAYKAGAAWVTVNWDDIKLTKLRYKCEDASQLSRTENWEIERMKFYADTLPARISISSPDPDGMSGVDHAKMQQAMVSRGAVMKPFREMMDGKYQWTILAVPSKKWAAKVFPEDTTEVAVEKLWDAILSAVHVTVDNDPVKEWKLHDKELMDKAEKLTDLNLESLHYESDEGTDFTCQLIPGANWIGGGESLEDGTYFNPNMPTEEVFTTPMKGRCEGRLVSTLPLSVRGTLIDKFAITFKDGKVDGIETDSSEGREILENLIKTDEGACMLGELALVPVDSPISRSGILFFNTLFDENAACHVALGRGFNENIPGYRDLSKEQLDEMGVNDSMIHVDFMIGSDKLNVTGTTREGERVEIIRNGRWAI